MSGSNNSIGLITIDGPGGVGKGTISALVAEQLGWHYLDSGALYRLTALACVQKGISLEKNDDNTNEQIADVAQALDVKFLSQGGILLEGQEVEAQIRTEVAGNNASKVAVIDKVRNALFLRQKDFLQVPGLVADGRDMGTTIFPEAPLKIFLTASAQERAKRRYKQLIEKGITVKMPDLVAEIQQRDERDMNRLASPLKPAQDAQTIDTSELSIKEVFAKVMRLYAQL
ncbi:MAG: (d)CMP kinase [gamma proteobacterium symbiont of Taylorina sp.]|nr:(d)CMP kinase [gamma proteobacterium symbiont of Taylorina sp.]